MNKGDTLWHRYRKKKPDVLAALKAESFYLPSRPNASLTTALSRLREFLSSFNPMRRGATSLPLSINNFVWISICGRQIHFRLAPSRLGGDSLTLHSSLLVHDKFKHTDKVGMLHALGSRNGHNKPSNNKLRAGIITLQEGTSWNSTPLRLYKFSTW